MLYASLLKRVLSHEGVKYYNSRRQCGLGETWELFIRSPCEKQQLLQVKFGSRLVEYPALTQLHNRWTKVFPYIVVLVWRGIICSHFRTRGPWQGRDGQIETQKNAGYSSDMSTTALPIITFKFVPEVEGVDEVGSCQSCHRPSSPSLLPSPPHSFHLSNRSSSSECLLHLLIISSHSAVSSSRMWHLADTFIPSSLQYHGCVHY